MLGAVQNPLLNAVSTALELLTSVFQWVVSNAFLSIIVGIVIVGFIIGLIIQKVKG